MRIVSERDHRAATPGRRPVVFVVDDDLATLELMREVALDAGWEAHGFTTIAELRQALEVERPALLILDDDLPDGRGGDLARDMNRDPSLADVRLLVCTAAHPLRQAEIAGWAPVVSKPFDLGVIERFLIGSRPGAHAAGSYGEQAG